MTGNLLAVFGGVAAMSWLVAWVFAVSEWGRPARAAIIPRMLGVPAERRDVGWNVDAVLDPGTRRWWSDLDDPDSEIVPGPVSARRLRAAWSLSCVICLTVRVGLILGTVVALVALPFWAAPLAAAGTAAGALTVGRIVG